MKSWTIMSGKVGRSNAEGMYEKQTFMVDQRGRPAPSKCAGRPDSPAVRDVSSRRRRSMPETNRPVEADEPATDGWCRRRDSYHSSSSMLLRQLMSSRSQPLLPSIHFLNPLAFSPFPHFCSHRPGLMAFEAAGRLHGISDIQRVDERGDSGAGRDIFLPLVQYRVAESAVPGDHLPLL